MTSHNPAPLAAEAGSEKRAGGSQQTIGAGALTASESAVVSQFATRLRRDAPTLARSVVDVLVATVPAYARLPREQLAGDVEAITVQGISGFAHLLDEPSGSPLPEATRAALARSAAQRAEEGVSMADVVSAYFVGARHMLATFHDELADDSRRVLDEVTVRVLDYVQMVTVAVADGYQRERQLTLGEELSARLQFGRLLVDGADAAQLAEAVAATGVTVAAHYTVVAVHITASNGSARGLPSHRDDTRPTGGADDTLDGRQVAASRSAVVQARLMRRVRARLLNDLGDGVLWLPHGGDALVLIPRGQASEGVRDDAAAQQVTDSLAGLEVTCVAGLATGRSDDGGVAVATRSAIEVRDLARRVGRAPACYTVLDLALELQLARPGPAQRALVALIEPLRDEPVLLRTLRAFAAESRHRQRSARTLDVHPNTIDNRLRRITALTGLDPLRLSDMQQLQAALTSAALATRTGPGV